ncbi:MAG TPA: hypothetical protein VJB15_02470, partial [Rhodothermia bacterium]|nr:hypothetical protein [Rhodothermia bacterium]
MMNQLHRATLIATLALLLSPAGSWGQDANDSDDWFRDRIDHDAGLTETQRSRMHVQLQRCKDVGMTGEQLDAMFPDGGSHFSGEIRLRMQELVLELAGDGQPYDLLCNKIAEGEMKRARDRDVERAVQRMGEYVGAAHLYMQQAKRDGVAGLDDARAERHLQRGLAMNMWRGLQQDELDRLRTQAQGRLRDGSCDLIELSAAAETATELKEIGVGSELAVGLCGDALREGYAAVDMRRLGRMAIVANRNGEPGDRFCDRLRDHVRRHNDLGDIQHMMMQDGWMGPESMGHGYGGHSPVDDVMGGGHQGG